MNGPKIYNKPLNTNDIRHLIEVSKGLGKLDDPVVLSRKKSIKYKKRKSSFSFAPI